MKPHPYCVAKSDLTGVEQLAKKGIALGDVQFTPGDTEIDHNQWQHPDQLMDRGVADYARLLERVIGDATLPGRYRMELRRGLGLMSGPIASGLPLCNLLVRHQAYRALFEAVRPHWVGSKAKQRRWFFLTLLTDRGNALEYNTVIDFARTKRDLNRVLAYTGLNAVGLLELQAAANFPAGGHGSTLMLHGHYVGYTDDPAFGAAAMARDLCSRNILTNWLGAPTVKIDPIDSLLELQDKCRYINKPPINGKYLVPDRLQPTGYRLDRADVTASVALRLAEVLGHLDLRECMAGTGAGVALKRDWREGMQVWHRQFRRKVDVDVPDLIQRVWKTGRTQIPRPPVDIRREISRGPATAWSDAMALSIAKVEANRADYGLRRAAVQRSRLISSDNA